MSTLLEKDKNAVWHPFTQHQTEAPPLEVVKAKGSFLYTADGRKILDGMSSWWVNLHGHCHPYIAAKVQEQLETLEHVIFAGCTHSPAVTLAERVLAMLPKDFSKAYYSDNGSTAVEVGIRMALQYWSNLGKPKKRILAFRHAYHGDTFGAMSVSERSVFTQMLSDHLFPVDFIDPPLEHAERGKSFYQLEEKLKENKDYAAFVFEPLVQGVGGMLFQDAEELSQLIELCKKHEVLCISDEVFTGFGRTGKLFATDFLRVQPDIIALGKCLTGGTMTLAMTVCSEKIYEAFLSEDKRKTLFHGHSYTANPIACAAANASLDLLLSEESLKDRKRIEEQHKSFSEKLHANPDFSKYFKDVRSKGVILALEWADEQESGYLHNIRDRLYSFFLEKNFLLRPFGNLLMVVPPYCTSSEDLEKLYSAIIEFAHHNYKN